MSPTGTPANEESGSRDFERVHTINEFWDLPRSGVADFRGVPHYYHCLWDDSIDYWGDIYLLALIDRETFEMELEAWKVWVQWELDHHAGKTSLQTHPTLAVDRSRWVRYDELQERLKPRRTIDESKGTKVRAIFRGSALFGLEDWMVKWTPI